MYFCFFECLGKYIAPMTSNQVTDMDEESILLKIPFSSHPQGDYSCQSLPNSRESWYHFADSAK